MYDVERMSFAIWSPYTTYSINDTVEYVSFTYSALSANTNKIPTDFPLVWKFRGSASGGGTVTNPLTSDLIATGFTVLNQSGNAPEDNSIRLSGSKVFNIVTTELTQLFTVDANSNVYVGATGNVANLFVGNNGGAENGTAITVQEVYGTATLAPTVLDFSYTDYRNIRLLNNTTPQIEFIDATNAYTVNLSSGNDDLNSGLTITTPVYNAIYLNNEMRITANISSRTVDITPNNIVISNGAVATAITETSVTSGSFVGTLTGSASKLATGAIAVVGGVATTLTLAQLGSIVTVTGSTTTSIILPTGSGLAIGNYYTIVNAMTNNPVNVYQTSAITANLLKSITHVYTVASPLLTSGVKMIWTGSIWASTGGVS